MTEIEISNEEALTQMMLRRALDLKTDNVLIAEFMCGALDPATNLINLPQTRGDANIHSLKGSEVLPNGTYSVHRLSELKYHSSWDWLMPVVNKCLNIYHVEQMNDDLNFKFYDSMGNINTTYNVVVEFINQLKNK